MLAERKAYGVKPKNAVTYDDVSELALWRWEVLVLTFMNDAKQKSIKNQRALRSRAGRHIVILEKLTELLQKEASPSVTASIGKEQEKLDKILREKDTERQKQLAKKMENDERDKKKLLEKEAADKKREAGEKRKREDKDKEEKKKPNIKNFFASKPAPKAEKRGASSEPMAAQCPSLLSATEPQQPCSSSSSKSLPTSPSSTSLPCEADAVQPSATELMDRSFCWNAKEVLKMDQVVASGLHMASSKKRKRVLDGNNRAKKAPRVECGVGSSFSSSSATATTTTPKFKLVQFHENYRPPYWGTWSKKSTAIRGRAPFRKEPGTLLDYSVDSDDEWEDEDPGGENLSGNDSEDDDEREADQLDYNDGWLCHEDEEGSGDKLQRATPLSESFSKVKVMQPKLLGPFFRESQVSATEAFRKYPFFLTHLSHRTYRCPIFPIGQRPGERCGFV